MNNHNSIFFQIFLNATINMLLEIVSLISALAILFWLFIKNRYRYWERCGIASVPAEFPFGSVKECLLTKKTVGETLAGFYQ